MLPRHRAQLAPVRNKAFGSRGRSRSAFRVFLKKFDRVADGQDGLSGVIGDFAAEFFLKGHHKLDRIEAVGAEIVDKACPFGYFFGLDAQMFHDDLLNPLANVTHRSNLVPFDWAASECDNGHRGSSLVVATMARRTPIAMSASRTCAVGPPQPGQISVTTLQIP